MQQHQKNQKQLTLTADFLSLFTNDRSPKVKSIGRGYTSNAYIATFSDRSPLVILQEKEFPHESIDYGHYFTLEKLLQRSGSMVVAPEVFISNDRRTLATTYLDGNDFSQSVNELDKDGIFSIALMVFNEAYKLQEISYEDYFKLSEELGMLPKRVLTYAEKIKSFSATWLNSVHDNCPDNNVRDWCVDHVTQTFEQADQMFTDIKPVLIHYDLTGGNMVFTKGMDRVYFLDWGVADFVRMGDEFYVSYMTSLIPEMHPYKSKIIQYVAEVRGHDVQDFADKVYQFELHSRPLDVLWAAMMYTKALGGEIGKDRAQKFLMMARKRIDEYSQLAGAKLYR
jgi:thiamine kinase-like enzyme